MGLLQSISVLNKNVRKTKAVCVCACVWSCMFLICPLTPASHAEHTVCTCSFFSCFFPSACRSLSAALLRVTMIMAGAVCGQMLPVVVKAQTISRSDGFLFLPLSLSLFLCATYCGARRESEEWRVEAAGSMNVWKKNSLKKRERRRNEWRTVRKKWKESNTSLRCEKQGETLTNTLETNHRTTKYFIR